jgi:Tol biopolymer transport system component/aminoglycoside phosphotransferase (APT) family kinase protein
VSFLSSKEKALTDPERRRRVEEVCDAALDRDARERAAFVAAACAGDDTLRQEVEALLAHAQTAEGFLAVPMGEVAARVLTDEHSASLVERQIGSYTILSLLGAGGMGEVYRARDTRLGREVAVKVVPDAFLSDPDRLARFEREARVLATLNHPHIGAIYGFEESDGVRALVLELVEGQTLAERLTTGPLPVKDALKIARDIADALEAAHEKAIVHRDLKPANIKLTPDGVVKVLDFGLAKVAARDGLSPDISRSPLTAMGGTRSGVILGTAAYMSPEQARGHVVDKRTDIWAFGCVLYEMLTGRQALAGETVSDTIAAILEREPDWAALPDTTPAAVRRLLQRCLAKDPRHRVRDIGDARIELEDVLAGRATGAPVAQHGRRERVTWISLALVALAALAVGSVLYLGRSPTDTRAYRSSILPPAGVSLEGLPSALFALSPDGRRLVFVGNAGGVRRLWVQSLDGLAGQPLAGTESAIMPFWSPDSESIGFLAGGKVKRTDATGGPPVTLTDANPNTGATWNRDGTILFASFGPGNPIRRVSASGGAPSAVTTLNTDAGETQHTYPFFLPDGRHFLYLAVGSKAGGPFSPNGIYVTALDSSERKLLVPGGSNVMYAQGYLFFLRGQTLMAQPFDVERLELTGDATPLAERVAIGGRIGTAAGFSVSETGVLAYQTGPAGGALLSQLVWFDRSGKQIGALGDQAPYGDLALTPDGGRLAVSLGVRAGGGRDIWLFDVARGLRTRFTFDVAEESASVWSPDGSRVVFNSRRKGHLDLYQKASSGAGVEEQLLADDFDKYPVDWSPDGRFILFGAYPPRAGELWVLPLFGDRKPYPFLQTKLGEAPGRFSPDGRWIAYASNESGRNEVYVAPFPGRSEAPSAAARGGLGTRDGKWQISIAGGNWPRWRRDGREIFYLAPDNKLMAVVVNGQGSAFEVGAVRALFDTRALPNPILNQRFMYDASPDGQRFLVNTLAEEARSAHITPVVNWPALLKK